jgi:hypothetical protein
MSRHLTCAVGVVSLLLVSSAWLAAGDAPATQPSTRPAPAPLSNQVKKGLAWLAKTQMNDGSWGQGEESSQMGDALAKIKDTPNVADTCMALMALYNSGSTPTAGDYQHNIVAAVNFICGQVEAADSTSLSVTTLNGTRTQMKLGPSIDTFMAAQALAEMKGKMADAAGNQRVESSLKKVLRKMELNQQKNGQWAVGGWAPTLAQGQAAKAANVAVQGGAHFDQQKLAHADGYARSDIRDNEQSIRGEAGATETVTGPFTAFKYDSTLGSDTAIAADGGPTTRSGGMAFAHRGAGNAGVPLYSAAADIAAMQAAANTDHQNAAQNVQYADSATTQPDVRARAQQALKNMDANDKDLAAAQKLVAQRMQDPQFADGFGSNGGEEYLSYLNIGESLSQKGGDDWTKWAKTMSDNLNRIQNDDGSWSGGHCITGRTFCTAAAIQVLCIDRSPVVFAPSTQPAAQ